MPYECVARELCVKTSIKYLELSDINSVEKYFILHSNTTNRVHLKETQNHSSILVREKYYTAYTDTGVAELISRYNKLYRQQKTSSNAKSRYQSVPVHCMHWLFIIQHPDIISR